MRKISDVDQILQAKEKVACDRDLLRNLVRFLRKKITRLEAAYQRKHYQSLKRKIENHRALTGFILQSIEAVNAMIESPNDSKVLKSIKTIFQFLVQRISLIKKASNVFSCKFKGIYAICEEMIANAAELKQLIAI